MLYYRGSTRAATTRTIRERFGIDVPLRTLSSWIAEYRDITAFARMRDDAPAGFLPHRIVRPVRLHPRQVSRYSVHPGKLRPLPPGSAHPPHVGRGPVPYKILLPSPPT